MINVIKGLLDLELIPIQESVLINLTATPKISTLFVAPAGAGQNFILGVYAILRAIEQPGSRVIITTAAFRLAKQCFEHCESLMSKSKMLKADIHHDPDQWWMKFPNDSTIKAISINDGMTKIRGERAHTLIFPHFSSIPKNDFEMIIAGFGVVNIDPVSQVKRKQKAESLGLQFDTREYSTRMVLSEYDDVVSHKYMKATQETDNFGLIEIEKRHFPDGWWDDRKRNDVNKVWGYDEPKESA